MKFEAGTVLITSTGNKIVALNDSTLVVDEIFFAVESPDDNGSEGFSDGTNNFTYNTLYNETSTTKSLVHWKNVGGTKTKTLSFTITSLATAGEFSYNVDTRTENTKYYFLVKGH